MQRIKNRDVLDVMEERGDTLKPIQDVHHWIYFKTPEERDWYTSEIGVLGYAVEDKPDRPDHTHPYGLAITRDQSVTPDQIDDAALKLFRLAKQVAADYDGWEAQLTSIH